MKIVFIGPPASGKGTQAEMLAKKMNLKLISTGNVFRQEIKNQTELGLKVAEIINSGNLVSDEMTNQIIDQEFEKLKDDFILDGYPRNFDQAKYLDEKVKIDIAFEVWISEKESMRRLSGRRVCQCGQTYHLIFNPPKKEEVCNFCNAKLFQREDDTEEKIKYRFRIYQQKISHLIDFYQKKGILIKIDGEKTIPEVFEEILNKLKDKI